MDDAESEGETDASDTSYSNSAEDDDSQQSEGEELELEDKSDAIPWVIPEGYRTRVHACSGATTPDGRPIPLCRRDPFSWAAEAGVGLKAAEASGRMKHAACWARCGITMDPP